MDRIRQLIGMTNVNLGVACKLIFAFPPENMCKCEVKWLEAVHFSS